MKEASALVASQKYPGIYWTLNDSGNSAQIYAFDEQGRSRGTFRVDDAENDDWESMQLGPAPGGGFALYIGDTGDNDRKRRELTIYRIPEPEPSTPENRPSTRQTAKAEAFSFRYPGGPRDTETMLVHPKTGEILTVSKEPDGRSVVFRMPQPLDGKKTVQMEQVGNLDLRGLGTRGESLVTDGSVAADASRLMVRTYTHGIEFDVPPGATLASVWTQAPRIFPLADFPQGEGLAYRTDGSAILTIGEGVPTFLYQNTRECS